MMSHSTGVKAEQSQRVTVDALLLKLTYQLDETEQ